MTTRIMYRELPSMEGNQVSFSFIVERSTKKQTTTEKVELSATLADNGLPADKVSAIAIGRMFAAVVADRKARESEFFADYRTELKVWRERLEAVATDRTGMKLGPKPEKPDVPDDIQAVWDELDRFIKSWRSAYGQCGRWTFKVGKWQGTLSAILTSRPSMATIAIGK